MDPCPHCTQRHAPNIACSDVRRPAARPEPPPAPAAPAPAAPTMTLQQYQAWLDLQQPAAVPALPAGPPEQPTPVSPRQAVQV